MAFVRLDTPGNNNISSLAVAPDIDADHSADLLNDETFGALSDDPVILKGVQGNNTGAIDDLNEDTFGAGALSDDWEESHEKFAKISDVQHPRSNQANDKEVHEGGDSSEEEIINNTISQLGLDDEQEEQQQHESPLSITTSNMSDNWEKTAPEIPSMNSPLSALLSQDRNIWSSPDRGVFGGSSSDSETLKFSLGHTGAQGSPLGNVDMQKVPLPPPPGMAPLQQRNDVLTVEEIENELKKRASTGAHPESPQVVPGYLGHPGSSFSQSQSPQQMVPPNLRAPPSGAPLIPSPGMYPNMMRPSTPLPPHFLSQAQAMYSGNSPRTPYRFPSPQWPRNLDPLGLYHQTMIGNRFQGDPGSLLNMPPMIDNRTGMPIMPHPFFNMPRGTPRPNRYPNSDRRQGTYDRYQRPEHIDENRWIKLPPSDLMTSKEKEWIVKIQLMQLLSCDPFISDYYYINHMTNKLRKDKEEEVKDSATPERTGNQDSDFKQTKKMLEIIQQNQEERAYKPAGFEGSLGKLSATSVHHPRQIFDMKHEHDDTVSPSKAVDPSKKRFAFFSDIEKAYDLVIDVHDIDRKMAHASDQLRTTMLQDRFEKILRILSLLHVPLSMDMKGAKDYEDFLIMMSISKSRKFLGSLLKITNQEQSNCIAYAVACCLGGILKKELSDEVLPPVMQQFTIVIKRADPQLVSKLCDKIKMQNMSTVLSSSFGISFLTCVLSKFSNDVSKEESRRIWFETVEAIVLAIPSLSPKVHATFNKELKSLVQLLQSVEQSRNSNNN